jgi:hypothetical protein
VVFHRYRTTAWDFFIQHLRYGHGRALICRKYRGELPWGWRRSLQAYRDLGKAALATTVPGHSRSSGEAMELETAYFDFLRQLGQRMGFLRGTVASLAQVYSLSEVRRRRNEERA